MRPGITEPPARRRWSRCRAAGPGTKARPARSPPITEEKRNEEPDGASPPIETSHRCPWVPHDPAGTGGETVLKTPAGHAGRRGPGHVTAVGAGLAAT